MVNYNQFNVTKNVAFNIMTALNYCKENGEF